MKIMVGSKQFIDFIFNNKLFDLTQEHLIKMLENWWNDDNEAFQESMCNDLETVLKEYTFANEGVSLSKSFAYDPPLDYISVWIEIFDEENSYICEYTAFYDYQLRCFDDKIS